MQQRHRRLASERPVERGEQVGVVGVDLLAHGDRRDSTVQTPARRKVRAPAKVAGTDLGELTGRGRPVEDVLAHRLQQPVTPVGVVELDEALVDETAEEVQHVVGVEVFVGAHRFGGVETEPADEGAESAQHCLFVVVEQVVAPVDRGGQGALAGQRGAGPAGEHPEAVVELDGETLDGQSPHPGGGQLEGQGDAIEALTDLRHRRRVGGGDREVGSRLTGPLDEQHHRVIAIQPVRRGRGLERRDRQRRRPPRRLTVHAERFPAGRHHVHAGTALEQPMDHRGDRRHDMLAVVDHEQRRRRPQHRHQLVNEAPARNLHQAGGRRHHIADTVGVDNGGEVDPPDAVGEPVDQLGGDLLGEAGLAHPAGPGHSHQPLICGQATQLGQLGDPPDQRSRRAREVVAEVVHRPKCVDVVGEIGMDHLPHPLGTRPIASGARRDRGGWPRREADRPPSERRRPTAAPDPVVAGPQPGTADHRVTHVVVSVTQLCFTAVHHAHPHAGHLVRQRPSHIHRRGDRIRRPCERGHNAAGLHLFDRTYPTMSGDPSSITGPGAGHNRIERRQCPLPQQSTARIRLTGT